MRALAAVLIGLAAMCVLWPPAGVSRLVHVTGRAHGQKTRTEWRERPEHQEGVRTGPDLAPVRWPPPGAGPPHQHEPRRVQAVRPRSAAAVSALAGVAVGFVVGGGAGVVVGIVAGLVVRSMLGRMPSRAERLRRERLLVDLPLASDLLAACLRSGRSRGSSVEVIAGGIGGPLGDELARVAAALRLGSEPQVAWATFLAEPVLASFGRAMVRAWESGAPLAVTLERLALDARRTRRGKADQKARAVGVRSAVPLALCFLPAFVLVGVVPLVAGAVSGLVQ
jgi:Flp pilus assembly protein TadB